MTFESDICSLQRRAREEARISREELERLYAAHVDGEVRYHFLWRLTQLGKISSALEQSAHSDCSDPEELSYQTSNIPDLIRQATELRQEAGLLATACRNEQSVSRISSRWLVSRAGAPQKSLRLNSANIN